MSTSTAAKSSELYKSAAWRRRMHLPTTRFSHRKPADRDAKLATLPEEQRVMLQTFLESIAVRRSEDLDANIDTFFAMFKKQAKARLEKLESEWRLCCENLVLECMDTEEQMEQRQDKHASLTERLEHLLHQLKYSRNASGKQKVVALIGTPSTTEELYQSVLRLVQEPLPLRKADLPEDWPEHSGGSVVNPVSAIADIMVRHTTGAESIGYDRESFDDVIGVSRGSAAIRRAPGFLTIPIVTRDLVLCKVTELRQML